MSEPFQTSFLNFQKLSHGRLLHRSQWHQLHPRERLLFSVQDFRSGKTRVVRWNEKQFQPGRGRSAFPSWNPDYTQHLSSNSRSTGAGVGQPTRSLTSKPGAGGDDPLLNGPTEGWLHSSGRPGCRTPLVNLLQPLHVQRGVHSCWSHGCRLPTLSGSNFLLLNSN